MPARTCYNELNKKTPNSLCQLFPSGTHVHRSPIVSPTSSLFRSPTVVDVLQAASFQSFTVISHRVIMVPLTGSSYILDGLATLAGLLGLVVSSLLAGKQNEVSKFLTTAAFGIGEFLILGEMHVRRLIILGRIFSRCLPITRRFGGA